MNIQCVCVLLFFFFTLDMSSSVWTSCGRANGDTNDISSVQFLLCPPASSHLQEQKDFSSMRRWAGGDTSTHQNVMRWCSEWWTGRETEANSHLRTERRDSQLQTDTVGTHSNIHILFPWWPSEQESLFQIRYISSQDQQACLKWKVCVWVREIVNEYVNWVTEKTIDTDPLDFYVRSNWFNDVVSKRRLFNSQLPRLDSFSQLKMSKEATKTWSWISIETDLVVKVSMFCLETETGSDNY